MKIVDLPCGWSLHHEYDDPEIGPLPMLIHKRYGRLINVKAIVARPEAREVFAAIKRWLDDADSMYAYSAQSIGAWKAADKAKFAIEDALRKDGLWCDSLLGQTDEVGTVS